MIDFYITNHTKRQINSKNNNINSVILHYSSDCIRLNADYDEDGVYAPNSGILKLYFGSAEDMKLYFFNKGITETPYCNICNYRSMAEGHDEQMQLERNEQEMHGEIADGTYKNWIPITKIYKAITPEDLFTIEINKWKYLHNDKSQSNPTTQIESASAKAKDIFFKEFGSAFVICFYITTSYLNQLLNESKSETEINFSNVNLEEFNRQISHIEIEKSFYP